MNVFLDPAFAPLYDRYPVVLVDVGARGGLRAHWRPMRPHLRLVGFEPDPREFEALSRQPADPSVTFLPTALHRERAIVELYIARDRGLSSIYRPNRPFLDAFPDADRFDTIETRAVQADSLDGLMREHRIDGVDFLKIDTQGSELLILEGAAAALDNHAVGVEVEAEFAPLYRDQPLFADVDAYLRRRGFALFDIRPVYWKRAAGRAVGGPHGQIVWADTLYLKTIPTLHALVAPLDAEAAKAKLLKAISIALLYGYCDYAIEIARTSAVLSAPEQATIQARIRAGGRAAASSVAWPGRRVVASVLHRLWKRAAVRSDAWSVSDPSLGND